MNADWEKFDGAFNQTLDLMGKPGWTKRPDEIRASLDNLYRLAPTDLTRSAAASFRGKVIERMTAGDTVTDPIELSAINTDLKMGIGAIDMLIRAERTRSTPY